MADTSKTTPKTLREVHYYRQRYKNRVFSRLLSFFVEQAKASGLTKGDIASILKKDPAQITRVLRDPSNLTLDTISDFLLAMGAEAEPPVIVKFSDRPEPNYAHPLAAKIMGAQPPPVPHVPRSMSLTVEVKPNSPVRILSTAGSAPAGSGSYT